MSLWDGMWVPSEKHFSNIFMTTQHSVTYYRCREAVKLCKFLLSFSLVSTIEVLLERKSSGSGLENREYGLRDPSCWQRDTLYPQKFADMRQSLGRYSSLADWGHGVYFFMYLEDSALWCIWFHRGFSRSSELELGVNSSSTLSIKFQDWFNTTA
jgi:hypothetical protein